MATNLEQFINDTASNLEKEIAMHAHKLAAGSCIGNHETYCQIVGEVRGLQKAINFMREMYNRSVLEDARGLRLGESEPQASEKVGYGGRKGKSNKEVN